MVREHETHDEELAHITAEYVAQVEAGQHPSISDYIRRYPQFADAIADFVAYYHTIETDISSSIEETTSKELSTVSQNAMSRASSRVYGMERAKKQPAIATLLMTHTKRPLELQQLAASLELGVDVVLQLERRQLEAQSIPLEVSRRLALLLREPVSALQHYFLIADNEESRHSTRTRAHVAEEVRDYSVSPGRTFLQAIEESVEATEAQKMKWREIVAREQA
jgi:hypothetical protein